MLNIHERRQCGIPVIIEGETGVGKTALINMLSKLWNHALTSEWRKVKGRIVEDLYKKSCGMFVSNLISVGLSLCMSIHYFYVCISSCVLLYLYFTML